MIALIVFAVMYLLAGGAFASLLRVKEVQLRQLERDDHHVPPFSWKDFWLFLFFWPLGAVVALMMIICGEYD